MRRFLIIIEQGNHNYSAYVPDLPGCIAVGDTLEEVEKGCIATGKTVEEVKANMREAIRMHLEGMIEDQEEIPAPQTLAEYLDIAIPDPAA